MSITQNQGPIVVGGRDVSIDGYQPDYNPDAAPSPIAMGTGVLDPRFRYSDGSGLRALFWGCTSFMPVLDQAPSASSATILATAQAGSLGVPLTLRSSSTTGATVLSVARIFYPNTQNTVPVGAVVLDGNPGRVAFGQNGSLQTYDRHSAISRALVVTWAGNDATANLLVSGYDIYGAPMTEQISGASGTTSAGKKAFKAVVSAVPGGTLSGSNISLGTTDTFGFPIAAFAFAYADITWNSTTGTSTGFTAALIGPSTSTTADVRGTYAVPSAADGTKRLQVFVMPLPEMNQLDLVGITQA